MSNTIRTAVIGYGLAGRVFHSPFIAADRNYSLDAVVTSNPRRIAAVHADHPSAMVLPDFQSVLDAGDLDMVILGTPPELHFEQASAALEAGLAVVVDKPFVLDSREGEALLVAAERANRALAVFQNRRWDGDFLTVRALVDAGAFGEIYQFESSFEYWGPADVMRWHETTPVERGGGVTYDLGSHLIDQAMVLFGPVESVHADLRTVRAGTANDDVSLVELVHRSGVRSQLRMNRLAAQAGPRFRVLGTEASFVSYGLDGQESALAGGMSPDADDYGVTPVDRWGRLGVTAGESVASPVEMRRGEYPAFYATMAKAVRGEGPAPVSGAEALEVTRILESIRRTLLAA